MGLVSVRRPNQDLIWTWIVELQFATSKGSGFVPGNCRSYLHHVSFSTCVGVQV